MAAFAGRLRGAVAGADGSAARGAGGFLPADLRAGVEAAGFSTATLGCAGLFVAGFFAAGFFATTSGVDDFGAAAGAGTVG
ncbi:MAG: hypothetical protein E2577_00945 [Starkeya sp.]|nr:hypothetical protein [Starkeya sp.]